MHSDSWSIETVDIKGPEDLREVTRGSDVEVTQLKPGKFQGSIRHIGIGNLEISLGQFNCETRMRGALQHDGVVLGTVLNSAGRVTLWGQDVLPGDVGVFPGGVEFDSIHSGGEAYLTVALDLPALSSMLGGENDMADPAFWNMKGLYHPDPHPGDAIRQRLKGIVSDVGRWTTAPTAQAADFLQRSIVEAFVMSVTSAMPTDRERPWHTGDRLLSETEDYVDAAGERPVHVSEICSALKVSRRSLHRAFADTLGVGHVAYLRRRRLSAIRSVLKRCNPSTISIGDLAFEYGFPEPGRFAAYYRAHFGETPSETCLSRMGKRGS